MFLGRLACCLLLAAVGACQTPPQALPESGRVFVVRDGGLAPAPDVLVQVGRTNICDRGVMAEGSSTGIDTHLLKTDAGGEFRLPARDFAAVCSRVALRATAVRPGFKSEPGKLWLKLHPDDARLGVTANDAVLVAREVSEARAGELAAELYTLFGATPADDDGHRQIYLTLLPEIEALAQSTSRWHDECYRLASTARRVDQAIGRVTCRHYDYHPAGAPAAATPRP